MAATVLKRSAVVWVPPRVVGERAFAAEPTLLAMLPSGPGGAPQWSRTSLEALGSVKSLTLVFDARDVTLMPAKLPPLSGAKLARALPNLVEDALLQDAQACAIAVGPRVDDDRRLLAIIDRGWLEFVVGAFERRGVRVAAAWPAQLALPLTPGRWSVGLAHAGIALRTGETDGVGWSAAGGDDERLQALDAAFASASLAGARPDGLVAFAEDRGWQSCVAEAAGRMGLPVDFGGLPAPQPAPVDLLSARQGSAGSRWVARIDWRAWRWPAAFAAASLAAFLLGLNLHWASLARERDALRAAMVQTFRDAFPDAQVVVDPVLQMQRQVAEMRLGAGRSGPGDYLPLVTRFTEALGERSLDAATSIEYRDGRLRVRLRPGLLDGPGVREALSAACRQRGLKIDFDGEGPGSTAIVGPA